MALWTIWKAVIWFSDTNLTSALNFHPSLGFQNFFTQTVLKSVVGPCLGRHAIGYRRDFCAVLLRGLYFCFHWKWIWWSYLLRRLPVARLELRWSLADVSFTSGLSLRREVGVISPNYRPETTMYSALFWELQWVYDRYNIFGISKISREFKSRWLK